MSQTTSPVTSPVTSPASSDDLPVEASSSHDEAAAAGTPVVVRRNAGLAALVGAAASAIAIAYLWRASVDGALLDWALCAVMAAIGALYLANLVDARTPLLVADDLGVRIRLGRQWRGLPWDAVERVVVAPRRGLLRDGRLLFAPHSLGRALDGLDARGRRAAALNQKVYGAALAVPMGLTTRVSVPGRSLVDELAALTQGQVDVSLLEPEPGPETATADADTTDHTDQTDDTDDTAETHDLPAESQDWATDWQPEPQPAWEPVAGADAEHADQADDAPARPRRSLRDGLGVLLARTARGRRHDADDEPVVEHVEQDDDPWADEHEDERDVEPVTEHVVPDVEPDVEPWDDGPTRADDASPVDHDAAVAEQPVHRSAVPLRLGRRTVRATAAPEEPAAVHGNAALLPDEERHGLRGLLPERHHLRRGGDEVEHEDEVEGVRPLVDDDRVRPIARLGHPVDSLVIDDFVTEPAYDPVIGPELAAARTRVGLSVDELAERTRIRPHVIESIEVDDFAPCGGDFYARGHLRTLARVLGRDPEPLLALFDNRYATAPINAKRVFEAELATGMTGSMRSTRGGPNWSLMIGVVLALVLTWGVIRLFATQPPEVLAPVAPSLNGSAGVGSGTASGTGQGAAPVTPKPLKVVLTGARAGSQVVVRDRNGKVVWAGEVALGEKRTVSATPPVKVKAANAGAVEVTAAGKDQGTLGLLGEAGTRTFTRPAH